MQQTVAFITNQAKTPFYFAWAEGLIKTGYQVVYISPSARWSKWLLRRGVPEENILQLHSLDIAKRDNAAHNKILIKAETIGPLTIKSMIQMDRTVCKWPSVKAQAYTLSLSERIDYFLRHHEVKVAFGETTWLVEILTAQILKALGGRFYAPSTARIPSERILFFEGPVQRSYARWTKANQKHRDAAKMQIEALQKRKSQPYYMRLDSGKLRRGVYLVSELLLYLSEFGTVSRDLTVLPLLERIKRQITRKIKAVLASKYVHFELPDLTTPQLPFIYVTLHTQPEASIDILGAPYTDQPANLRALARIIPEGYEIWVKEHRSAIGDHWPSWYQELSRIPGIRLISPSADGFEILKKAQLTLSPSGTVSFEAGVLGKTASCFASMYFSPILVSPNLCPYSTHPTQIKNMLEAEGEPFHKRTEFLADLLAHSFPVRIGDPITDPSCMEESNISALVTATDTIIKNTQKLRPPQYV